MSCFPPMLRGLAAAALALASIAVGPAASAVTSHDDETWIKIDKTAKVQRDGVTVVLMATVRCPEGADGRISVGLVQDGVGGGTRGSFEAPIGCNGIGHWFKVAVTPVDPETGEPAEPFSVGSASVSAYVEACTEGTCDTAEVTRTVRMRERIVNKYSFEHSWLQLYVHRRRGAIQADGASANVRVLYSCAPGVTGDLRASLAQLSDAGPVTIGSSGLDLTCDPDSQKEVLKFPAQSHVWQDGPAYVALSGRACDVVIGCFSPYLMRPMRLV